MINSKYQNMENKKFNLVLDVDETLVHTLIFDDVYLDYLIKLPDYDKQNIITDQPEIKNILEINGHINTDPLFLTYMRIDRYHYIVMMRPGLIEFLLNMNKYFNIYVYSLGTTEYINEILSKITDMIGYNIFHIVMANPVYGQRFYKKYLTNLKLSKTNTLIIDDRADVWAHDKICLYKIPAYNKPYVKHQLTNSSICVLNMPITKTKSHTKFNIIDESFYKLDSKPNTLLDEYIKIDRSIQKKDLSDSFVYEQENIGAFVDDSLVSEYDCFDPDKFELDPIESEPIESDPFETVFNKPVFNPVFDPVSDPISNPVLNNTIYNDLAFVQPIKNTTEIEIIRYEPETYSLSSDNELEKLSIVIEKYFKNTTDTKYFNIYKLKTYLYEHIYKKSFSETFVMV